MTSKERLTTLGDRNVSFPVEGNEDGQGYLSPINKDSKMGVVVIQEWWGMNQTIQHAADDVAKQGFKTIVPDLYRGKVAKDHEHAGHLMTGLDFPKAVGDIKAAVHYLLKSGCDKVGVVGFCMGGALTLLAAVNIPEVSAASCYHGVPDMSLWDASKIKAAVECHFGNKDDLKGFSDPETADKLEKKLKDAEVKVDFYRYEDTDHAFTNTDRPEVYNEKSAKLAWERTYTFFKKHLAK